MDKFHRPDVEPCAPEGCKKWKHWYRTFTVAVLGTARPGAEKICGAPTSGKKFGPNIIFCVFFTVLDML